MLKSLGREITLAVQARSGVTATAVVLLALIALAVLTAFAFFCVAGYEWFAVQTGSSVLAALIMAGIFAVLALIAAIICAAARRRTRERAILERAARARAPSWLLDPKILATAVQVGRTPAGSASCRWRCSDSWRRSGRASIASASTPARTTTPKLAETRRLSA